MKGIGDRYMLMLWRKAVLRKHYNRCFFCGADADDTLVDCHHIVKRKTILLRYDWRNGIPACRLRTYRNDHLKMSCHAYAETPMGKKLIDDYIEPWREYLTERSCPAKEYFSENGVTRNEFISGMKDELNEGRRE